jgi:glycerol-3-phosphate acyltransferase PlsY
MKLPDPRSFGSKNPGATNMLRGGSRLGAALVLLGDAFK